MKTVSSGLSEAKRIILPAALKTKLTTKHIISTAKCKNNIMCQTVSWLDLLDSPLVALLLVTYFPKM